MLIELCLRSVVIPTRFCTRDVIVVPACNPSRCSNLYPTATDQQEHLHAFSYAVPAAWNCTVDRLTIIAESVIQFTILTVFIEPTTLASVHSVVDPMPVDRRCLPLRRRGVLLLAYLIKAAFDTEENTIAFPVPLVLP